SVAHPPPLCLSFVQADSRELRISEHAERYESVARGAATPIQIISDDAEVVVRDVSELRAARTIAHRPNAVDACLQPLTDLDITACVEFDSGRFEADSLGIR